MINGGKVSLKPSAYSLERDKTISTKAAKQAKKNTTLRHRRTKYNININRKHDNIIL